MKLFLAGLLLLSLSCRSGRTEGVDPETTDPRAAVQVHVTNNHGYPVEIYAAARGTSYRLGTVLPGAEAKFDLRPGLIGHGPVELTARGRPGEQPARSGGLMLNPGDIIDFDIATHLLNSIATLRQPER